MGILSKAARAAKLAKKAAESAKQAAKLVDEYESVGGSGAVASRANRTASGKARMDAAAAQDAGASAKRSRRANAAAAMVTPKKGSIAKKTTASATDIKQATEVNTLSKYIRELKDASNGSPNESQKMRLTMAEKKLKKLEKEQSAEVTRAGNKIAQAASDRKAKAKKISLKPAPFEYARGGSVSKKKY
jgi:hypothetical protein